MTIQTINTGSGPNAGNGDSLRSAFIKINNNFIELSNAAWPNGQTDQSLNTFNSPTFANISTTGTLHIKGHDITVDASGHLTFDGTDIVGVTSVGDVPPTIVSTGTLWYDTVDGRTFIYYDDTWVDASPGGAGGGGAGGQGPRGYSGYSGISGYSGSNGSSGYSGSNGSSGYSGSNGSNGSSGYSGMSGYSGVGTSGYSGASGPGADQDLNTTSTVTFSELHITNTLTAATIVTDGIGGDISGVNNITAISVTATNITMLGPLIVRTFSDSSARDAGVPAPIYGTIVLVGTIFQGYTSAGWVDFNN